ncbi:phosphatase PAP2 family protein [Actinomyces haliotis]|uniref:phosphatase PAP2 family protein n=1 Tax=Actinomyces haliotis TaxID=1280843 RepID=UPI00188FC3AB|nr:phosphatase PAP2 family protein [Actinomyces haliotis]
MALSTAVTYAPVAILKMVYARPRPDTSLLAHPMAMHPGDWSFPPGHTAFVVSPGAALVLASLDSRASR